MGFRDMRTRNSCSSLRLSEIFKTCELFMDYFIHSALSIAAIKSAVHP